MTLHFGYSCKFESGVMYFCMYVVENDLHVKASKISWWLSFRFHRMVVLPFDTEGLFL